MRLLSARHPKLEVTLYSPHEASSSGKPVRIIPAITNVVHNVPELVTAFDNEIFYILFSQIRLCRKPLQ